jgi:hypothetical protein
MTQIVEIKKLLERPSLQYESTKLRTCIDNLFHTWIQPSTYDHQVCMCVKIYVYSFIDVCLCIYMYMYMYVCICMYIYV